MSTDRTREDKQMPKTVIQHVLGRLKDIGIDDIFAVAGDFAFAIHDAIVQDPDINYIGCCNELNAGYAADGYARVHGVGAVSTTYGVGELSAIGAVGGSYAENVPVFHLVGMPATAAQHKPGYLIERLLGKDPTIAYNDLAAWHYSELPHALGCDGWFTARVTTCGELDEALKEASQNNAGCYIEVVTGEFEAPPLPQKMHDSIATLYA